jgi:hypothetical protein
MALDGCRAAWRSLGADMVADGRLDEIDDVFFLTVPELTRLVGDTALDVRPLITTVAASARGTPTFDCR